MKKCSNCLKIKPLEDFQKRASTKDGRTNLCKPCKREYDNSYYKNIPGRKSQITENRKESLRQVNKYIISYLKNNPCIDCGEGDIVVLEFDHRGDKRNNVSNIRRNGLKSVIDEISKCDVRCANCHRRKTARENGSYRMPL